MKRLVVTFVGENSDVEAAKENVEDFLGNCPDEIRTNVVIEEIDYEHREEYVVVVNSEPSPFHSLESALKQAITMVNTGVPANKVAIHFARVSYLDGVYDGVNKYLRLIIDMKKIM